MRRWFMKSLNLRPGEGRVFATLYAMLFIANAGITWGRTIINASFVAEVGNVYLPWVMVAGAVLSFAMAAIYSAFADQLSNSRLLIRLMLFSAVALLVGVALVAQGWLGPGYFALYVLFLAYLEVFNLHWVTYVNGFYDTQSAKRLFGGIASAARLAAVVAGLAMPVLTTWLLPQGIVLVWLASMVLVAGVAWLAPRFLADMRAAREAGGRETTSYWHNLREGLDYVRDSSYLRWMAGASFLLMVIMAVLNYQSNAIFQAQLGSTKAIADFTGLLNSAANILMLPLQSLLIGRLVNRMGVGNANLIFPVGSLGICLSIVVAPSLITASLGFLQRTALRTAFHFTLDGLLYNAVPLRVKGRARAFIAGLLSPVGALVGSVLLLIPGIAGGPVLGLILGGVALAYVITAWKVRQAYTRALVHLLEQEDYSFLLQQDANEDGLSNDPLMLAALKKKLAENADRPDLVIFIAKLIGQVGGPEAANMLVDLARQTPAEAAARAALLDVLVAAQFDTPSVRQLYRDSLTNPNPRIRESAFVGLQSVYDASQEEFLTLAQQTALDANLEVRARALPVLLRASVPAYQQSALHWVNEWLNHPEAQQRVYGVRVLREASAAQFAEPLIACLADPADEVRLEAMQAVETLTGLTLPNRLKNPLVVAVQDRLNDPVEGVRQRALNTLGRLGGPLAYPVLVEALTDPSPFIRDTASRALAQTGAAALPLLNRALADDEPRRRHMAAVTLARIHPQKYAAPLMTALQHHVRLVFTNRAFLDALATYTHSPGLRLLAHALHEHNRALLDEVFYFLGAQYDPEATRLVAENLRSDSARARANASEALETMTAGPVHRQLVCLLDPTITPDQRHQLAADTWGLTTPTPGEALRQLTRPPSEPWVRALTLFAIGEWRILAATPPAAPRDDGAGSAPPAAAEPATRPKDRRRTALLDAVISDDKPNEQPKPKDRRRTALLDAVMGEPKSAPTATPATAPAPPPVPQMPFSEAELRELWQAAHADSAPDVREVLRSPGWAGLDTFSQSFVQTLHQVNQVVQRPLYQRVMQSRPSVAMLSPIEKIIFLKDVPFFQGMTVNQLRVLASVCEEEFFAKDAWVFQQNDLGGTLYMVVSGKVGIELEKRKGSFVRLATIEPHSYFGELSLFDQKPRSSGAIAVQDTLTLRLRREPLIALIRQHPDMSLELLSALSLRLREMNDRIAELSRTKTRELQKFFDAFEEPGTGTP